MQRKFKIVGEPSYVLTLRCKVCKSSRTQLKHSALHGKMKNWCPDCGLFIHLVYSQPPEEQICHAVESRNNKFGRTPDIETEDGRPFDELKTHQPIIQDWYEWAHLELYKYTEREKHLKARVIHNIYTNLRDKTIDEANASVKSIASIAIENALESIIGDCAEMMRPNSTFIVGAGGISSRTREINRGYIASKHGINKASLNSNKMRGQPFSSPICRLIDEIGGIITTFEICI